MSSFEGMKTPHEVTLNMVSSIIRELESSTYETRIDRTDATEAAKNQIFRILGGTLSDESILQEKRAYARRITRRIMK